MRWLFLGVCLALAGCFSAPSNQDANSNSNLHLSFSAEPLTLERLSQLSDEGDPDAQYALGYKYYYGLGVVQNVSKSVELFETAAQHGQPQAREALHLISAAHEHRSFTMNSQPAPVPTHPTAQSQERLVETEGYTLQLFASNRKEKVQKLLSDKRLPSGVTFYRTQKQTTPWYVLVTGKFASRQQAAKAIQQLPPDIQALNPWIKSLQTVQEEMKAKVSE